MRLSLGFALVSAVCLGGPSAFAFGPPRSGCAMDVQSAGAMLLMEVYSEDTGWPEDDAIRQARQWEEKKIVAQFLFPDDAPLAAGVERAEGFFSVYAAMENGSSYDTSPWRNGWSIASSSVALEVNADWVSEAARVEFVAVTDSGETVLESNFRFDDGTAMVRRLNATPVRTEDGEFGRAFDSAETMEVRVLSADGSVLGAAGFDMRQANALSDALFTRMPDLLEYYEFSTQFGSFICNFDVEF